jgi:predicted aconitase with swiveling domain
MQFVLKGKAIVSGKAEGEAIVSQTPFSFFLGLNTDTGIIIEEGHEHFGKSVVGKILVYPFGKGSSGDCLRLWRAANNGVAPLGIINTEPDFVHVQGALTTSIPMVCNFDKDPVSVIKTGDFIEIDGDTLRVTPRANQETH